MRRLSVLLMLSFVVAAVHGGAVAHASPADQYSEPSFGDGNLPAGCVRSRSESDPANTCYHMKVGLNALDSPQVDVAVLVPVSPTAERDMRIMRQSVEMWEGGIDYLAAEMGLDWLTEGMDFHVTVDYIDPIGDEGGEFTTYPLVDPEIVVIATNPVGGAGIGVDPVWFGTQLQILDENAVPCHNIQNPFDFEYWENVPGFSSHHESRTGTYTEDCGGAGGNVCFAINGAVDPVPGVTDVFSLFDLVAHEFGHCLTVGHVGDGADGPWGPVPTNDIMAYSADPPGLNKCVSTLDVEGIAVRMSHYLDQDGNGTLDGDDHLVPNDLAGDGSNPFQVQHPDNHLYASATGSPLDCPQPDLGTVPGPRTDWTPEPVDTTAPVLTVTAPDHGAVTTDGTIQVSGTVEHRSLEPTPPATTGSHDDPDDDATTPLTEIEAVDVDVDELYVNAALSVAQLWPSTDVTSLAAYSVIIDGRRFDSFIPDPTVTGPVTWDAGTEKYLPDGTSTWDVVANTVSFHLPRAYLAKARIEAPYFVTGQTAVEPQTRLVAVDDKAPDSGDGIGVAAPEPPPTSAATGDPGTTAEGPRTVTFERPGGNTFYPWDTSFGAGQLAGGLDRSHHFVLDVPDRSHILFMLEWTDPVGGSDLDLYVTGAADSGTGGATTANPEMVPLDGVVGHLDISVDPYLVTAPTGLSYTLTATITPLGGDADGDGVIDGDDRCPAEPGPAPSGCPDTDGDGVPDLDDVCPNIPGNGNNGCPVEATEHVRVYVDGSLAASRDVDTTDGPDSFSLTISLDPGTHDVRLDWENEGQVLATATRTVTYQTDTTDSDRDGVQDGTDNCIGRPNPDQSNIDGDTQGDACDPDIDGDGHSNNKERAHGTIPTDPNSYPGRTRALL